MKCFMERCRVIKWPLGLLALGLSLALAAGVLVPLTGSTRAADPLGYDAIVNHAFDPPIPPPEIFGPTLTAWTRYHDHPGHDTAFTPGHSRAYTGETSPNHIYIGDNALVFFGYDKAAHLDYILSEEYFNDGPDDYRFKSISFSLRPADLKLHALSQSGFLFNGCVTEDPPSSGSLFYTGYMIALEAYDGEGGERCADLRLYRVENAPLDDGRTDEFENLANRTLISTYAVGIKETDDWPAYIRVESDPATGSFQVFVDGVLRTLDLEALNAGDTFGFFASYIEHGSMDENTLVTTGCGQLSMTAFSNLRIEATWKTVPANAYVHFVEFGTGGVDSTELMAQPQSLEGIAAGMFGGQTGQYYYIIPPIFEGYSLVESNQKLLDPIPYFALDEYNVTVLEYQKKEHTYKEATYFGVQNNGTAKVPVPVDQGEVIDYKIHAGGDGQQWHYGNWVVYPPGEAGAKQGVITMAQLGNWDIVNAGRNITQSEDIPLGTTATSRDGKMTVESNIPLTVGGVSTSQGQSRIPNDGIIIGFTTPAKFSTNAATNVFPYTPPCVTSGTGNNHYVPDSTAMTNVDTNNNGPNKRADDRYITVIYEQLRNDACYQIDFLVGAFGNAKLNDYYYQIQGLNSMGEPVDEFFYRPTTLWNTNNNGNSVNGTPIADLMPLSSEYVDFYDGTPYIYPENGQIILTVRRLHNIRHDYNIFMGAGQMTMRARETIMTIVDYLPAGLEYVEGSSGQHEGNLTIEYVNGVNSDAGTKLIWEFGALPPDGYDVTFQAEILEDSRFSLYENHGEVIYSPSIITEENEDILHVPDLTNTTYHRTGDPVQVIEHFLDFNGTTDPNALLHATLQGDRYIQLPLGEDYTTSLISMGDIVDQVTGDVYRYIGYRRVGMDVGDIIVERPPIPTIPTVTVQEEIELYFARNPSITVKFRYYDLLGDIEMKEDMVFPVTWGDPFFLPDSVREPINYQGLDLPHGIYNYKAYDRGDPADGHLEGHPYVIGAPDKPVYTSVTMDQEIIVYFTEQQALTVRYVEFENEANVLKNNDYFLVPETDDPLAPDFDFAAHDLTAPISSMGKRYVYEGFTIPGDPLYDSFTPGMPDQLLFDNIPADMEIVLHFSTTYLVTVKWHENLEYYEGQEYDDLLPVKTFTVRAGQPFSITPQGVIVYDGEEYGFIGEYKWTSDDQHANAYGGNPIIPGVYRDYTIIFLYEPTNSPPDPGQEVTITVMYREYGNTLNVLDADVAVNLPKGASFNLTPYFQQTISGSPNWNYFAYEIDSDGEVIALPPGDPLLTDLQTNHVILLEYIREDTVVERFREYGSLSTQLLPDRTAPFPGTYTPADWIPPQIIDIDALHVYEYVGYQINDGPFQKDAVPNPSTAPGSLIDAGDTITYLYTNTMLSFVKEEFRLLSDPGTELAAPNYASVPTGGDYIPGVSSGSVTAPEFFYHNGRTYYYAGYSLDGDAVVTLEPPPTGEVFLGVTDSEHVITYFYRSLTTLHVRQVVLLDGVKTEVDLPLMGYLKLTSAKDSQTQTIPATCYSGREGTPYTSYALPLDIDDIECLVKLIVPQYYTFEGHIITPDSGDHDSEYRETSPPNGEITLNFGVAGELWLTLYIAPRGAPGYRTVSYATNDFGVLPPPQD